MNMITCGEDCRFQIDGYCTKCELTFSGANTSKCCYFEKR